MGLDPSSPEMTFLLVMLHTGTMFAVIAYFWKSWRMHYFGSSAWLVEAVQSIAIASTTTVIIGLALQWIIEKILLHGQARAEVEVLFSRLPLMGAALLASGLLIIYAGSREEQAPAAQGINSVRAGIVGLVQGLCLPLRDFTRSGGTISTGLLLGVERGQIEEFSFALAVVLTPLVIAKEWFRLIKAHPETTQVAQFTRLFEPGLLGMVFSFGSGLAALWWLSSLLEAGRWKYFGYYCLVAATVVSGLAQNGF